MIHQKLMRPVLLGHCPPENSSALKRILDRLGHDEVTHIGYTAQIINQVAASQPGFVRQVFCRRTSEFNQLTIAGDRSWRFRLTTTLIANIGAHEYDSVYTRRDQDSLASFDRGVVGNFVAQLGCIGFRTRKEAREDLRFIADSFHSIGTTNRRLVDVGCGSGGYGVWLGSRLRATTIGLDLSIAGLRRGKKTYGQSGEVLFAHSNFEEMPLAIRSCQGAVALDSVYLSSKPEAALNEIGRVLESGALVFTTLQTGPRSRPEHDVDWGAWEEALAISGFECLAAENCTLSWRRYMLRKHRRRWHSRDELLARYGQRIVPDLRVTAAMLGIGDRGVIARTHRANFRVRKRTG